ncbi:bacteriohemerythrin [Treponema primitia]|uniref:bacteriohemerythrin n=1 Tax=Treponema primitia TaxID=88058 RepID=UPI0039808FAD
MESDAFVEWDDRYSVGIPLIDDQHKELIRLTNELYKGCLTGDEAAQVYFMSAVKGTVDYVKYHFSAEEKLLENAKYPEIADHKKQHESFIKQILGDVQSYQGGKKFVPNVFVRYLRDWILSHIAVMDKKYAAYILNLKKQGALSSTIGV